MVKKLCFLQLLLLLLIAPVLAQNKPSAFFLGLNPSITVEPFYKKGEMDINIFPVVFQKTLTNRIDLRLATTANLGIREAKNSMSHLGGQLCFPIFILKKQDCSLPSKGFYIAPGVGFTRNLIEKHTNIGLWAEPGYNLLIDGEWAVSLGVQLGATHFNYDNGTTKWGNHFGVKIIFGKWFFKN